MEEKDTNKRHVTLSVGCPNSKDHHGAFSHLDGSMICDCGEDITHEFADTRDAITQMIEPK